MLEAIASRLEPTATRSDALSHEHKGPGGG